MPDSQHSSDTCETSDKQILLVDSVILAEFHLYFVSGSVPSAAPGSDVLCLSQTSPCKDI